MYNEPGQAVSQTCRGWQVVWQKILVAIAVFLGCLAIRCWLHYFQSRIGSVNLLYQLRCVLDGFFVAMPQFDWFMCLESSKLSGKDVYLVGAYFYTQLTISGIILIAKRPIIYLLCFPLIIIGMLVPGISCFVATLFGDFFPAAIFGVIVANATGNFYFAKRKLKTALKM